LATRPEQYCRVNATSGPWQRQAVLQDFLATVWPALLTADSEAERRKKIAVRTGQLSMAAMVRVGLAGIIVADFRWLSAERIAEMGVAGVVYLLWSLHGMQDAVRFLFVEREAATPSFWVGGRRLRLTSYFAVHLALAGLLYGLGVRGYGSKLLWLAFLPPIGPQTASQP
jgi:hypothetical protein